jgi:hypothetical protein
MRMRRYEDLLLWQKAMQLAKMEYLQTYQWPLQNTNG